MKLQSKVDRLIKHYANLPPDQLYAGIDYQSVTALNIEDSKLIMTRYYWGHHLFQPLMCVYVEESLGNPPS